MKRRMHRHNNKISTSRYPLALLRTVQAYAKRAQHLMLQSRRHIIFLLAKRSPERVTCLFETTRSGLNNLWKQVEQQQELLSAQKNWTKGKRVALKGKLVFSTEEVLKIAKQAGAQSTTKRPRGRSRKCPITAVIERDEEGEERENISSDFDNSFILVARHI